MSSLIVGTGLRKGISFFVLLVAGVVASGASGEESTDPTLSPGPTLVRGSCPAGEALVFDDFESGTVGWTSSGSGDTWALSSARTRSGVNAFHAENVASVSDQRLVSPAVDLPITTQLVLEFWNHQTIEDSAESCFDGAVVEISSDDGATWVRLEAELLTDPYDGPVAEGFSNPLAGENAWCGDPQDWLASVVDVTAFAGETVRFRFRLATDSSVGREGWYIDDFAVKSCGDLVPLGVEIAVSEETGSQREAAVAAQASGEFVAVWQDRATGGAASTIRARHFNSVGAPSGPSLGLGIVSTEDALQPSIAAGDGNFLVVWHRQGTTDQEIFAQRLDSDGDPLGSEFQVNSYTSGDQSRPVVAARESGEFLVVWQSDGTPGADPPTVDDTSGLAIVGRRVNGSGVPQATDFQINSYTTEDQACPSVVEREGFFAVAWQSGGSGTDSECLQSVTEGVVPIDIRSGPGTFGADASLDEVKINSSTNSNNVRPEVAMRGDEVVVVWEGDPLDKGVVPIDIQGRRYTFNDPGEGLDITLGDEVVIDGDASDASRPTVAALGDDFLAVVWDREGARNEDIFGKFGSTLGNVVTDGIFEVNTSETGAQLAPAVAATSEGLIVLWQGDPSDGKDFDDLDIRGQLYELAVTSGSDSSIFADGFESGDTTVWSSTTP